MFVSFPKSGTVHPSESFLYRGESKTKPMTVTIRLNDNKRFLRSQFSQVDFIVFIEVTTHTEHVDKHHIM